MLRNYVQANSVERHHALFLARQNNQPLDTDPKNEQTPLHETTEKVVEKDVKNNDNVDILLEDLDDSKESSIIKIQSDPPTRYNSGKKSVVNKLTTSVIIKETTAVIISPLSNQEPYNEGI